MANVKFSKNIFEKEIGKLDEKMQEKIALFGTPLEKFNEEEIEIEVFPNRPDLLSYHGFKRAFLSFLGKQTGLKNYKINKAEKDYKVIIDSSVKDIRPNTACAIVKNLKLDDNRIKEIIDVQEKLHLTIGRKRKKAAIGIYPLEKIKLPISYKAIEPDKIKFMPLEMSKEMSGLEILQKIPAGKEYASLLAGKEKFPIFIDSSNNIMSMPPIINSHLTGKITTDTKDVFIECSGFDLGVLKKCLNIIVTMFADMGGSIYNVEIGGWKKYSSPDLTPEKIKVSVENTNKLLGLKLSEKEIKEYVEKMGHNYNKGIVEVPAWRIDILHEVDIIEDIAIAYGYEKFIPEIPMISTIGETDKKEILKKKISGILCGLGILEVSNYHLTTKNEQFYKMGIPEKQEKDFVEVESSKSEYNLLRKDLTHYILKNFSENVDSEYPQKIFELGTTFESKDKIVEKELLTGAITPGNFTELKQIVMYLFRMLSLNISIKEPEKFPSYYIEGRIAEIFIENKSIGFLGEIHPRILNNWKIRMPVALFEINLEEVFGRL